MEEVCQVKDFLFSAMRLVGQFDVEELPVVVGRICDDVHRPFLRCVSPLFSTASLISAIEPSAGPSQRITRPQYVICNTQPDHHEMTQILQQRIPSSSVPPHCFVH